MNTSRFAICATACILGSAAARAGIVASDDFSYPDGHLGNQNGGVGWTIPWTTASNPDGGWEVAGGAVITEFVPYGSYVLRWFNNPVATPELFIAVDIRLPAVVDVNDYILVHLSVGVNFTALALAKPPGSSEWSVAGSAYVSTGITVQPNTTYRIVGVYDVDHGRVAMWINPTATDFYNPTTGASSADAVVPYSTGHVGSLTLYAWQPNGSQKADVGFDNLVIGNTPADVGLLASAGCVCPGDMSGDGIKDGRDVQKFVTCMIVGGDCSCAEMDGVGGLDMNDAAVFVSDLLNGAICPP